MRTNSGLDLSNPDPLGLAYRQRADNRRMQALGEGGSVHDYLDQAGFDPQWDRFLEATSGAKMKEGTPYGSGSAVLNMEHGSNQMGAAGQVNDILAGLTRASRRSTPGYQTHEQWMAAQKGGV